MSGLYPSFHVSYSVLSRHVYSLTLFRGVASCLVCIVPFLVFSRLVNNHREESYDRVAPCCATCHTFSYGTTPLSSLSPLYSTTDPWLRVIPSILCSILTSGYVHPALYDLATNALYYRARYDLLLHIGHLHASSPFVHPGTRRHLLSTKCGMGIGTYLFCVFSSKMASFSDIDSLIMSTSTFLMLYYKYTLHHNQPLHVKRLPSLTTTPSTILLRLPLIFLYYYL